MMLTYPATVLLALILPGSAPAQVGAAENPVGAVDENAVDLGAHQKAEPPAESADESPDRPFRRGRDGLGPPERPGRPGGFRRGFEGAGRPGPGQVFERIFSRHDKNGDGKLTKDEVPPAVWERLAQADTDGDGAISKQEARAAARERLRGRSARGPARRMGPRARWFRGGPGMGFGRGPWWRDPWESGPARWRPRFGMRSPGPWQGGPPGPWGPPFGMRRGGPRAIDAPLERRLEQLERQVEELKKAVQALSKPAE